VPDRYNKWQMSNLLSPTPIPVAAIIDFLEEVLR